MEPLKLRVLSKFGTPEPLQSPDEIEVNFPYESSESLCKRMSYGHVKILNDQKGEISVELSPFEIQGMPEGDNQNFVVKITNGNKSRIGMFTRSLHIRNENNRKVLVRK